MKQHRNFIAGEWVAGRQSPNINPSDTNDVVGEYAQADAAQTRPGDRRRARGVPGWSLRVAAAARRRCSTRSATRSCARKDELGELLSREEGKTLPEGIGEVGARRAHLQVLRRRGAAPARATAALGAARHRRRDHARAGRRGRHHHAVEFPDRDPGLEDRAGAGLRQLRGVQAGRPGARQRLGAGRDHRAAPACPPGVFNLVMGRGRVVGEAMLNASAAWTRSASPARSATGARRGRRPCAPRWRRSSSRWAARTRWWCWTTPTSTTRRRTARSTAPSSRPASAAPPPRA